MGKTLLLLALTGTVASCGTKVNPDLCCTDELDCSAKGIPVNQMCTGGLICRGEQCIAETCTDASQCEAGNPFCGSSGLCVAACDSDAECPGFDGDTSKSFCEMGGCVTCRTNPDCGAATPVCDGGTCRLCEIDSECLSGACGDNGACLGSDSIVYVAPTGSDVGVCTQQAPCLTLQYAVQKTLASRSHVVLSPGTYLNTTVQITSAQTSAPAVTVHGNGATLMSYLNGDTGVFDVTDVATTIQDVTIRAASGSFSAVLNTETAPCTIRNVKIDGLGTLDGFYVGSNVTMENVDIANVVGGIVLGSSSHLQLDRVAIHGGKVGIRTPFPNAIVNISNLLVYDLTETSLDLTQASGTIQYSTIARTIAAGTNPAVVNCAAGLTIQSSIIWMEAYTPVYGPCLLSNSIAGPFPTDGATTNVAVMRNDPLFLDEEHRDLHLTATSPAVDQNDSGPPFDFDGTARPQGPKFDLGAFEYKP